MTRPALPRQLEAETLDHLREDDPRAIRSRRDLRRVNRIMGSLAILDSRLRRALPRAPARVAEIGAGDGTLLLRLAKRRARAWPGVAVTFVDRQDLVGDSTRAAFARLGWTVNAAIADVFAWLERGDHPRYDAVVANLFIHHFEMQEIKRLFRGIARITDVFVACEPRRSRVALMGSRLIGLLGANDVTRRDAVLSVRAGFRERELSALWPAAAGWALAESGAGLFSQAFIAVRGTRA